MTVQTPRRFPQALTPLMVVAALASASVAPAQTAPALRAACDASATTAPSQVPADMCDFTVIFTTGDAALGPETRRALDRAAPSIIDHLSRGGLVLIEGYADAGTLLETRQLSLRRAEAVATYLDVAWGIPARRLTLRGWGADLPDGRDRPQTAQNRRVTITLRSGSANTLPRLTALQELRPGHLNLDDFGGARNPLPGPRIGLWHSQGTNHD